MLTLFEMYTNPRVQNYKIAVRTHAFAVLNDKTNFFAVFQKKYRDLCFLRRVYSPYDGKTNFDLKIQGQGQFLYTYLYQIEEFHGQTALSTRTFVRFACCEREFCLPGYLVVIATFSAVL